MANQSLFKDEKAAKSAFDSWILKADVSANTFNESV